MTNTTSDEYLRNMHMDIYFPFDKDKSFQRFKDYHNSLLDTLESELQSKQKVVEYRVEGVHLYDLEVVTIEEVKQAIERHKL